MIPGDASACLFDAKIDNRLLMACLNSSSVQTFLDIMNPTLNYPTGTIAEIPLGILDDGSAATIKELAAGCVELSKEDWDSFETSWNFCRHPLI